MNKRYGLSAQFVRLLLVSAAAGAALFLLLQVGVSAALTAYFDATDFEDRRAESRAVELQQYVTREGLALSDTDALLAWCKRQPLLFVEIFRGNVLRFDSSNSDPAAMLENEDESPYYDWLSYHTVTFADGDADVVIYSDETYLCFTYATIAEVLVSVLAFLLIFLRGIRGIIGYIRKLSAEIQILEGGDLDHPVTIAGNNELSTLARSLDDLRTAFKEQRENEAAFFSANQALITGMSHDLRTPLTKLMLYAEILKYGKYDGEEQRNAYLGKIDETARQLKQLSDNLFEYALVAREGEAGLEAPATLREIFHDPLSELVSYLAQYGFSFAFELDWEPVYLSVRTPYIKRLLDNITSNLIKYADPAGPVRIETRYGGGQAGLFFQNEIRRDAARQEGTHIGLENMCAMMEKMHGACITEQTDGRFTVELRFPCRGAAAQEGAE